MTANPRCPAADSKQKLLRNQIKFNKKNQIKEDVCVMEWSFELILFLFYF